MCFPWVALRVTIGLSYGNDFYRRFQFPVTIYSDDCDGQIVTKFLFGFLYLSHCHYRHSRSHLKGLYFDVGRERGREGEREGTKELT